MLSPAVLLSLGDCRRFVVPSGRRSCTMTCVLSVSRSGRYKLESVTERLTLPVGGLSLDKAQLFSVRV